MDRKRRYVQSILPKEFEKQPLVAVCGRFAKCSFVAEPLATLERSAVSPGGLTPN